MMGNPTGTVTFLFTDIEGSTKLAQHYADRWETLRDRHHAILRHAVESHQGYVFQIIGDAFCVAFHTAGDALRAAAESQINLCMEEWGEAFIKVRMGIHTGKAEIQADGQYHGYLAMSRVQRLMSAGHGGQVLISTATQELLLEDLPEAISLRDLGKHRLKDLNRPEHIYQLVSANIPDIFPPIRSIDALPNNLPIQLTSFIGREKEIGDLKDLVKRMHLVTLTGVGGTGKTRLALQVGAEMLESFDDGVWFVELAPLTDPEHIPQTIVSALRLRAQADRELTDVLTDYLSKKEMLLILDNCEHMIDECAQLTDMLLHAAPRLKILVTSREALGIAGESTYPVRSLAFPRTQQELPDSFSQYESVRLFIDRALSVQPGFQVTNQNAPAVAQICARLDGIPLAIELAASLVKGMGTEQIAARLDDRFRLLTGGSRTALPRQRTLQATIDWSYKLLTEEERVLMRRLSAFAGGWTIEAAEQVCADEIISTQQILSLLIRLVETSLVAADMNGIHTRYYMLETIRQYAQEKLEESGESNWIRDQHLSYFCSLVSQAKPNLISFRQAEWLERLEAEHDNIRAALAWAMDGGSAEAGLRMVTDLFNFWIFRAYFKESSIALEYFIAVPLLVNQIQLLARAHATLGWMNYFLGDGEAAIRHARESERLCLQLGPEGKAELAAARNLLNDLIWRIEKDLIQSRRGYEENLILLEEVGDRWGMAHVFGNIGLILHTEGNIAAARQAYEQSLTLFQECGDHIRAGQENMDLAALAIHEGNYIEARRRSEEIKRFYSQIPVKLNVEGPLWLLGVIALREGKLSEAKGWYTKYLLFDEGAAWSIKYQDCFIGFAGIACAEERFEHATLLIGAVDIKDNRDLHVIEQAELERLRTVLREQLGSERYEALLAEGKLMSLDEAIAVALEVSKE